MNCVTLANEKLRIEPGLRHFRQMSTAWMDQSERYKPTETHSQERYWKQKCRCGYMNLSITITLGESVCNREVTLS